MDLLNILSLYISIKNLDLNLSQDTAGKMLDMAVQDIHAHLQEQDKKIDLILKQIGVAKNEADKQD